MKAVGLYKYLPIEHAESLLDVEIEKPVATGNDLLIEIKAISINPIDTKQRAPKEQVEETPRVLGWDASGIVVEVGEGCSKFKVGDEVYYSGSVTRPGVYSEYQLVDERLVAKKPTTLTFAEAAALPLTSITAWESLFERLEVKQHQNKSILIIGGAGGVGSIAIQLAKLAGLHVITTASREETKNWVNELGADVVINHKSSLVEQLNEIKITSVDYILNLNSTDLYWDVMAQLIKPQGKICCLVDNKEPLDLKILKSKSVTFVWEFMFTKTLHNTDDQHIQGEILEQLAKLIEEGKIISILKKTLSPINASTLRKAHATIETGRMIGKLVVEGF